MTMAPMLVAGRAGAGTCVRAVAWVLRAWRRLCAWAWLLAVGDDSAAPVLVRTTRVDVGGGRVGVWHHLHARTPGVAALLRAVAAPWRVRAIRARLGGDVVARKRLAAPHRAYVLREYVFQGRRRAHLCRDGGGDGVEEEAAARAAVVAAGRGSVVAALAGIDLTDWWCGLLLAEPLGARDALLVMWALGALPAAAVTAVLAGDVPLCVDTLHLANLHERAYVL